MLTLKSFLVDEILLIGYRKWFLIQRFVIRLGDITVFIKIHYPSSWRDRYNSLVWSKLCNRDSAWLSVFVRRAGSSALSANCTIIAFFYEYNNLPLNTHLIPSKFNNIYLSLFMFFNDTSSLNCSYIHQSLSFFFFPVKIWKWWVMITWILL